MLPARFFLTVLLWAGLTAGYAAEPAVSSVAPPASQPAAGSAFDVQAAVDAYLSKMPAAQRARSDAYFEGGYWLLLWNFLATVFVMWLLLHFRVSARMRQLAARLTGLSPLQTALYWIQFILVVSVATFPLGVYEDYFREHQYHLLNQTFGPWMRDQMVALMVSVVLGAILIVPLFGLIRRFRPVGGCGEQL